MSKNALPLEMPYSLLVVQPPAAWFSQLCAWGYNFPTFHSQPCIPQSSLACLLTIPSGPPSPLVAVRTTLQVMFEQGLVLVHVWTLAHVC